MKKVAVTTSNSVHTPFAPGTPTLEATASISVPVTLFPNFELEDDEMAASVATVDKMIEMTSRMSERLFVALSEEQYIVTKKQRDALLLLSLGFENANAKISIDPTKEELLENIPRDKVESFGLPPSSIIPPPFTPRVAATVTTQPPVTTPSRPPVTAIPPVAATEITTGAITTQPHVTVTTQRHVIVTTQPPVTATPPVAVTDITNGTITTQPPVTANPQPTVTGSTGTQPTATCITTQLKAAVMDVATTVIHSRVKVRQKLQIAANLDLEYRTHFMKIDCLSRTDDFDGKELADTVGSIDTYGGNVGSSMKESLCTLLTSLPGNLTASSFQESARRIDKQWKRTNTEGALNEVLSRMFALKKGKLVDRLSMSEYGSCFLDLDNKSKNSIVSQCVYSRDAVFAKKEDILVCARYAQLVELFGYDILLKRGLTYYELGPKGLSDENYSIFIETCLSMIDDLGSSRMETMLTESNR